MTRYRQASGPSFRCCAALGYLDADRSAVVLVRDAAPGASTPLDLGVRCVVPTLMTAMWRAPSGAVYTADRDGVVRWATDPWGDDGWRQQELDLVFQGMAGRDDDQVWAFGIRSSDGASLVRCWDGRNWKPVTAPGFEVHAVAVGVDSWFVGAQGWVARHDGDRWSVVHAGTDDTLVAAHEAGGRLLVATAGGRILWGDLSGFEDVGQVPVRPHAVASWGGDVWVGGGSAGLFRVRDGVSALVRADRPCRSLDARADLLIGCDDVISGTADGERFPATGRAFLG